jgi:hypothetical protein
MDYKPDKRAYTAKRPKICHYEQAHGWLMTSDYFQFWWGGGRAASNPESNPAMLGFLDSPSTTSHTRWRSAIFTSWFNILKDAR